MASTCLLSRHVTATPVSLSLVTLLTALATVPDPRCTVSGVYSLPSFLILKQSASLADRRWTLAIVEWEAHQREGVLN
jgi:hypothetical protein